MDTSVLQQSWLILLPQLPAKPDYLRVKLQRRMQRLGAVLVKNGVYALPLSDETTRASEWLRAELVEEKGDLIVLGAVLCAGLTDTALAERFHSARAADYAAVESGARAALALPSRDGRRSELARLRKTMAAVDAVDFFSSTGHDAAVSALRALAQTAPAYPPSFETRTGATSDD